MRISDWSSDVCSSDLIRDENSNCYSPSSIERQVQGVDAPHSVGAERGFPGDGFDAAIRPGEGDFNFERLQWAEVALGQDDLDSVPPRAARAPRDVRHGAPPADRGVGPGRGARGQDARAGRNTGRGRPD